MLRAQDRERQLAAYEIHDGLAQQLTAATMQFQTFEQLQDQDHRQAADCYSAGLHMLKESLSEARRLISGLRPPILDESGVVAAIAHLVHDVMAQNGLEVEFHSSVKFKRLGSMLENAIFRIVQESLTNICRHSRSDKARVRLVQKGDRILVEVQDWGTGFDPDSVEEKSFGLAGIRERARLLGGQATIDSTPGKGTRIAADLPLSLDAGGT
jgi:signal transduction histidine kinase